MQSTENITVDVPTDPIIGTQIVTFNRSPTETFLKFDCIKWYEHCSVEYFRNKLTL